MKNLLNEILKSDTAARQKLLQAEEYRREQIVALQSKKDEIEKEELKIAVDALLEKGEKRKTAGDRQLSELKENHKAAEKKMSELYDKNCSEWVRKIVDGVING